jgi:hypothetical protein
MMDSMQRFRVAAGLALLPVSFAYLVQISLLGESPKNADDISPDALYLLRRYEWRLASK